MTKSLHFILYSDIGGPTVTVLSKPDDITIKGSFWIYKENTPCQQTLEIGSGIRIPDAGENKEFWGPMMVIDPENEEHQKNLTEALKSLQNGTLVH